MRSVRYGTPRPQAIYDYFDKQYPGMFRQFDSLNPVVSAAANFDEVRAPSCIAPPAFLLLATSGVHVEPVACQCAHFASKRPHTRLVTQTAVPCALYPASTAGQGEPPQRLRVAQAALCAKCVSSAAANLAAGAGASGPCEPVHQRHVLRGQGHRAALPHLCPPGAGAEQEGVVCCLLTHMRAELGVLAGEIVQPHPPCTCQP